jgi:hypothetical protein
MSALKRSSTVGIRFTHGEEHVAPHLKRTSKPAPAVQRRKPCWMVPSDMQLSEPATTHSLPNSQLHGSMAIAGSTSRRSSWLFPQHRPGTRRACRCQSGSRPQPSERELNRNWAERQQFDGTLGGSCQEGELVHRFFETNHMGRIQFC